MRFSSDQIQRIGKEISNKVDGKTLFDEFSRGRYSTDASVYQIKPLGVVLPKDTNDVLQGTFPGTWNKVSQSLVAIL